MKKQLHILSSKVASSLRSVKRDSSPAKVGDFFALQGAWDRKKVAVKVVDKHNVKEDWYCYKHDKVHKGVIPLMQYVQLQNVGRIYSDGRWVKPTRRSGTVEVSIPYDLVDGKLVARDPMYTGYVKVQPAAKPARVNVVTNKSVDPKTGRFNEDGTYKGPWLTV